MCFQGKHEAGCGRKVKRDFVSSAATDRLGAAAAALLPLSSRCPTSLHQAAAWGVALRDVPQEALPARERSLCDRCGTQVAGLVGHCSSCQWDCCSSCVTQLRLHTPQQDASADTAGSDGVAEQQQIKVTCCNPACPSVSAKRRSSSSSGSKRQRQQDADDDQRVVVRGELWSVGGAAELALQVVLPPDLLTQLERLQQLAQVRCMCTASTAWCSMLQHVGSMLTRAAACWLASVLIMTCVATLQ
jgi:hypothetical protein